MMSFLHYQETAIATAIYPGRSSIGGIIYCALKLNGEAGEIAEKVGKALRDDHGKIDPVRRMALIMELGDVLWYINALAKELQIPLEEVAKLNLDKLKDRKARDTLHGEGDDR